MSLVNPMGLLKGQAIKKAETAATTTRVAVGAADNACIVCGTPMTLCKCIEQQDAYFCSKCLTCVPDMK